MALATSITLLQTCRNSSEAAALFVKDQAAMTVQKSFAGQTLRALAINGVNTFDLLNNLLYVTSKSLNVKENLNEFQAFDIINTLLEDYKDVKMEEFIYIFKQGKKGIYGPHYNKFDIETIVHWINSYFNSHEYNDYLENRHKRFDYEQVVLTEEQKQGWQKIAQTVAGFNEKPFTGNLESWIKSAKVEQLTAILADFEKSNFIEGINLIKTELDSRG